MGAVPLRDVNVVAEETALVPVAKLGVIPAAACQLEFAAQGRVPEEHLEVADDSGAKDWNLPSAQHLAVLYDLVGDDVGHRFLAASRGAWNAHPFLLDRLGDVPAAWSRRLPENDR